MIFNDWEYINKNGGKIIPTIDIPAPNSFAKYYGLNKYSVDALTNQYLFFSHPLILNDPFDSCRQLVNLSKFSERQFVKLIEKNRKFTLPNNSISPEQIMHKTGIWFREDKADLADTSLTFFWNLVFKDWGILSLAGINNDMLMWSYYTNHQGFVIEFDNQLYDSGEVIGPFPINYSKNYKTIFPRSIKLERENLLYATNVKSLRWKHEKEWRYLVNRDNMSIPNYKDSLLNEEKRKVNYHKGKVKSVILGYKFFQGNSTKTNLEKGKRLYQFQPKINKKDKLKLKILDYILDNNLMLKEIEIEENNTFDLKVMDVKLSIRTKGFEYFIESENYKKPSS